VLERLAEVGRWISVNGAAIHGTMPIYPYAVNVTKMHPRGRVRSSSAEGFGSDNVGSVREDNGGGRSRLDNRGGSVSDNRGSRSRLDNRGSRSRLDNRGGSVSDNGGGTVRSDNRGFSLSDNGGGSGASGNGRSESGGSDRSSSAEADTTTVQQWRLSRTGNVVFAMLLLLDNGSRALPSLPTLDLPFVVDAPGGVDGR
jgi:hypothetical protein